MSAPATTPNFAHLDALSTRLTVGGRGMLATSIYADAPSYAPIGDPDEGIACVDDVARAAIAYLDEHARTGDPHALEQARGALEFVLYMQEPDGRFVNFITDKAGTKNRTGQTSRAELGWWAFRGMWSLARGVREFAKIDPAFAQRLLGAYTRTEDALDGELRGAGARRATLHGRPVRGWLDRFPSDVASVAAVALAELQEAHPNARTARLLGTLADGIAASSERRGRDGVFDHAAHTVGTPQLWHAWGAHQGEALARAGRLLGRPELVEAARREVEGLLAWQLAAGRIQELRPAPERSGQQAYGTAMAVRGAMELYRATGDARYARIAGLHASWFAGNNMARGAMYDAKTGRGYDGIDAAPRGINRSSGAESTIEALMALEAIAGNGEAQRLAQARPVGTPVTWTSIPAATLRTSSGRRLPTVEHAATTAETAPTLRLASLQPGASATFEVTVQTPGRYVLLGSHLRAVGSGPTTTLQVARRGRRIATLAARRGGTITLDRLAGAPIQLGAGTHRFTITATGPDGAAPALLDSLVLHPVIARTELSIPGGSQLDATWSIDQGRLQLTER